MLLKGGRGEEDERFVGANGGLVAALREGGCWDDFRVVMDLFGDGSCL